MSIEPAVNPPWWTLSDEDLAEAVRLNDPPIIAVLDTNVKLDIYSCHDVMNSYNLAFSTLGRAAVTDPQVSYRRARAKEALLLAVYLNKLGAATFNLHHETIELLTKTVPPTAVGGQSFEAEFVVFFLHFVKEYLLPNWLPVMPGQPGTEVSNGADRALLSFAQKANLPLITNEGYTKDGVFDERLRKRAKEAGVSVFTAREFYAGKIDETKEIDSFLLRFRDAMPEFLAARERERGKDLGGEVLKLIHGYYRMVLRGEFATEPTAV